MGNVIIKFIYSPGHSPGSISLYTNKSELFTGDLAHYGAMFLPPKDQCSTVLESISKLIDLCEKNNIQEIYPSHEEFPAGEDLLIDLYNSIEHLDDFWNDRTADDFNKAWVINQGKFKFHIRVSEHLTPRQVYGL